MITHWSSTTSILVKPIMVFHGGQPSGNKKTTVGYRRKQGKSYQASNPAVPPCPLSNKRKDDNWRTNRGVKSAKRAQQKAVAQRDFVMETNTILQGKLDEAVSKGKALEHEQFIEKKASRAVAIKTAEEHKFAITEIREGFYEDIQAAYALADAETSRCLEEEERRIKDKQLNLALLQSQQQSFDSKLQKMKGDHVQQLQKERHHFVGKLEKESGKREKERLGQEAIVSHLHTTWQKRMEYNTAVLANNTTKLQLKLDKKDEKMMADRVQNEERYVFSVHSFFMTKSHSCCPLLFKICTPLSFSQGE